MVLQDTEETRAVALETLKATHSLLLIPALTPSFPSFSFIFLNFN